MNDEQKPNDIQDLLISSEILKNISTALDSSVKNSFMSREHGGAVWKQVLRLSGFDVARRPMVEQK